MPAGKPPEFRRRALDLVVGGEPVAQVAKNLGISESFWVRTQRHDCCFRDEAEGRRRRLNALHTVASLNQGCGANKLITGCPAAVRSSGNAAASQANDCPAGPSERPRDPGVLGDVAERDPPRTGPLWTLPRREARG